MANKKISDLTLISSHADTDLFEVSETGTASKKTTWALIKSTLKTYFDSLTTTLTNKTIAFGSNTITGLPVEIQIACSDLTTALTTGTSKAYFRMPYAMTLTEVRASLLTAGSTSGLTTIDINESGTTVLSTKLSIDFGEKTSETAATPAVISDSAIADDAEITIDIDAVTGGADEAGLIVTLIGNRA